MQEGPVVLVTGSSQGIGAGTARVLARHRTVVAASYLPPVTPSHWVLLQALLGLYLFPSSSRGHEPTNG